MATTVRRALVAALVSALLLAVVFRFGPGILEARMNRTLRPGPYFASAEAVAVHRSLAIADLHADTLLWNRDLLARGRRGHVDVPRLVDGNVALQCFTVVTKTPRSMNIESNDDRTDNITLLAILQLWPASTWSSLKERALFQAGRLREAVEMGGSGVSLIRSAADLDGVLERRSRGIRALGGLLGVEGAHALEGDLANLDVLFDAGFRMMAPTHFFDNDLAGSAHGVARGGLTDKGRELIRRMEARRMVVDLAHASPRTVDDVLGIATRPVVVSHTGVRGTCDNRRNLSDAQLAGIAKTGGLIGIGYWETAVCGENARAIARSINYAAGVAGVDHVALGSDFDGAIAAPFDTSGLALVTDALLGAGMPAADVAKVMGGNAIEFFRRALPAREQ